MKLKKGSAAAKAYMAKIRAKRKKATIGALPFNGTFDGVKFKATVQDNGILLQVGSRDILYKRGDKAGDVALKIANAIKYDNGEQYKETEFKSLKAKFTRFVSTLKDELPARTKKVTIKKPTVKKVMVKKSTTKQRGGSSLLIDLKKKAKAPGKRKSASGRTYYESRRNRSDIPGTMAGIGAINTDLGRKLKIAQENLAILTGSLAQRKELYKLSKSPAAKTAIPIIKKKIVEAKKVVALLKRAYKK